MSTVTVTRNSPMSSRQVMYPASYNTAFNPSSSMEGATNFGSYMQGTQARASFSQQLIRPMTSTVASVMPTSRATMGAYTSHRGTLHATQPSIVGVNSYTDEGRTHIISERYIEREVRVPKKVIREDIVEKLIYVPEKVVHEEVVEDIAMIRQKIVEVAKTIIQERVIEVPEIEYVERIVEVPEVVIQEKIREVPRIEIQERITEIPKYIPQERIVEVPEFEYQEVVFEKVVEVPEIREQTVIKQIPVAQYVDKPVPEYVDVEIEQDVIRNVPVPIEQVTTVNLTLPQIRPRYTKVDVPLYVPRFIEIAIPADMMDSASAARALHYADQVALVGSQTAASLCEIERLGGTLKEIDGQFLKFPGEAGDVLAQAWTSGLLDISGDLRGIPVIRSEPLCTNLDRGAKKDSEVEGKAVEQELSDSQADVSDVPRKVSRQMVEVRKVSYGRRSNNIARKVTETQIEGSDAMDKAGGENTIKSEEFLSEDAESVKELEI